ncbi:MAG: DUF3616 domain-containing protein [Cocleimonas sp.]|nr:DUF3616 domain-containing protein [Cocleimonas sp.]
MVYHKKHQAEIETIEANSEKKNNNKSPGSANKAIETMFRNAYRAQLDLLALAATKANIMISLNGAIVSILMVASGFIYAEAKTSAILLPATLFLITSVASIYFALSAASPSPAPAHTRIGIYLKNIQQGNFNFYKIRKEIKQSNKHFDRESLNILIFEDFSKLSKIDYIEQMHELMKNKDKVYEEMSAQLHHLGTMADRKYTMLRRSYSVFRWGVIISIVVFLFLQYLSSTQTNLANASPIIDTDETLNTVATTSSAKENNKLIIDTIDNLKVNSKILQFTSIYEPSGIQQLNDGRLIIVEDESDRALRLITPSKNQEILESKPLDVLSELAFQHKLNDLEAITMGNDGYLYAITSHKRNTKGKRKKSREQLIRFQIQGSTLINVSIVKNLTDTIKASKILESITKKGKKSIKSLDIEALSFDQQNRLMIGLRKPKAKGKSIILRIDNPTAIFTNEETIQLSKQAILLDLQGSGIRAMRYIPKLKGYLLANETKKKSDRPKRSQISFWDGNPAHSVKQLALAGLNKIDNIEGISPIALNGKEHILLLGDNGNIKNNKPANYLLLDYKSLPN